MGIYDVVILVFILFGGVIGYKRGVIRELVKALGLFLIIFVSFLLKNPLSVILYENLPFFKFGGIFKGVTVLNIAFYELIAFLIVFTILSLLWKLVSLVTRIVQKIIDSTIILGLPSSILGFIIGIVEFYIITFIVLYFVSLPVFDLRSVTQSKCGDFILNNTPVISSASSDLEFVSEFAELKNKYKNTDSASKFNYDTLDLFLKYDIVDVKSVRKLREKNKLKIDGIDELIKKYEEVK